MPLSKDETARQRQLANLKRGQNPPPSHLVHGASSRPLVAERRTRYLAELRQAFPSASQAELLVQANRMARLELLGTYLDERGVIRNRRTGAVFAAVSQEHQIATAFEKQQALLAAREQAAPKGAGKTDGLDDVVAEIMGDEQ